MMAELGVSEEQYTKHLKAAFSCFPSIQHPDASAAKLLLSCRLWRCGCTGCLIGTAVSDGSYLRQSLICGDIHVVKRRLQLHMCLYMSSLDSMVLLERKCHTI